jgi:hypothetical protein
MTSEADDYRDIERECGLPVEKFCGEEDDDWSDSELEDLTARKYRPIKRN